MNGKLPTIKARLTQVAPMLPGADSWRDGLAGSSTARGYGYAWQVARLEHLAGEPLCRMCKAQGFIVEATIVDHVKPHMGDQQLFWLRSNWQSLCTTCHSKHKQRLERAATARKGKAAG